jgi:hypothetical protein
MPSLKSLKSINQNPATGFQLVPKTNHTTPQNGPLIITIDGEEEKYEVVFDASSFLYKYKLTPVLIQELFDNGKLYPIICREQLRFNINSSQLKQLLGFICFDNIPKQLGPIGPIQFSILHFPPEFFCIRLGTPYDNTTSNFGIGYLKVEAVIDMFKKIIQSEFRNGNIQQLWFEFVHFLVRIGYFNIFDYNDFRSFSFLFFLKMFPLGNHIRINKRLNMFYSFVEHLMIGNRCFIIFGQNIRPVRGKLYPQIIKLFSEKFDPVVNFCDDESQCVGITLLKDPVHTSTCHLISLETMEVIDIGPLFNNRQIHFRIEDDIIDALNKNHPDDEDDDDENDVPLKRTPACGNDVSLIKNGIITIAGYKFFIFKTDICNRPIIKYFLEKRDGTFEAFPSFFLTVLHIFYPDNNRYFQLDYHFDGSIDQIVNKIVPCGFEAIFNRTVTHHDVLHHFFIESNFGIILRIMKSEYETHKSSLCDGSRDSIRETIHFKNFKRVLQMILRLLRERKNSELSPEIHELLQFMDVMIQL